MKLILIHADPTTRTQIKDTLNDLGHIVVAESPDPRRMLDDIARHQPHALIVGVPGTIFADVTFPPMGDARALVPVVRLPPGITGEPLVPFLIEALIGVSQFHDTKCLQPYSTDGQRLILQDDAYQKFARDEKLGNDLLGDADLEKEVVVRQIHYARRNHRKARRYLAQLVKTDAGFRPEITYRIVHSSYKVYWLREMSVRWASVLLYYGSVDLQYLPPPAPPSPSLDFLFWEAGPETLYAAAALVEHGFQKTLMPGFCALLSKKYLGQSPEELTNDAIVLLGWCSLLREVALAQVHLLDQILDPRSKWWNIDQRPTQKTHRAEGIYGEFWCLPTLRQNPSRFRDLAYLCVHEWLSPVDSPTTIAPYRSFFEAHQAGRKGDV